MPCPNASVRNREAPGHCYLRRCGVVTINPPKELGFENMPVLRFPNSQSDLDRLVSQMALIARTYPETTNSFSLDDMRDVLAAQRQISSSGASGSLAVARSTRPDRSRDPLYNQVKMMSEIYRMFGWMRSTPQSRLKFRMTHLGLTLALDAASIGSDFRNGLIRESILGVTFPNETTTNVGVANQRPFSWLLRLTKALDGFVTRDEIIVGLLGTIDDLIPGKLDAVSRRLIGARGIGNTTELVEDLSRLHGVQVNTLQNYTRLPIGILSSTLVGWARPATRKLKGFKTPIRGFELTSLGAIEATTLQNGFDLRLASIESLPVSKRIILADYSFYLLLERAGIPQEAIAGDLLRLKKDGDRILEHLGYSQGQKLIFNPELQEVDSILAKLAE
jgi:hypothetical protein